MASCMFVEPVSVPLPVASGFLLGTYPLDSTQKQLLEGIYLVDAGAGVFGPTVVLKWTSKTHLTVLTGEKVTYLVLGAGRLDSVFFFEGYWRSQNSRRTGSARFEIRKDRGGRRLMGDSLASPSLLVEGTIGDEGSSIPVVFRYQWGIRPEVQDQRFWIIAHRGGGSMADLHPHSENTVEIIRIAERYGANGIEIDVRLTKDDMPILYHDNTINSRLVQKTPMIGPVEDYTFPQLRTFVRLLHGERIPTLEEALTTIVYETNLKLVWLDSKTEGRDLVKRMVPLIQQYTAEAAALAVQGLRDSLEILIGVPTDAVYEELLRYPTFALIPSIAEKSLDKARALHSAVWAPLWSGGVNVGENAIAHSEGRRVFVWTLDEPPFVREFVNSAQYDGILSDYPMIVAYYHYVR